MRIDTPTGVSKPEKERIPRIESKADFPDRGSVRAEVRPRMRALMLILLMLASTQMALMTPLGPREVELDETPIRSETLDNSGVVSIDIGSNHACVIGTLNQMKCWGSGEDGKTGHENTASYGDDDKEMGQYLMFTDVGAGLTFTDVGAGQRHTCALINDGSVKCWGSNHLLGVLLRGGWLRRAVRWLHGDGFGNPVYRPFRARQLGEPRAPCHLDLGGRLPRAP